MSGSQRAHAVRPARRQAPARPPLSPLDICLKAQAQLTKAQEASHKWEDARKEALTQAVAAGISSQELADALGISRSKIYQLISSAGRVQA